MSTSAVAATGSMTFLLPDLGEGLTEAEVVEWLVATGDDVVVDQIVVTVETAKATVELPCPYAGPVLVMHSSAGDVLKVGMPLLTVGQERSAPAGQQLGAQDSKNLENSNRGAGSGNVLVGYGTSQAQRSGRRRVAQGSGSAGPPDDGDGLQDVVAAPVTTPAAASKVISPVVRKLAQDNGINLTGLALTGPDGVIRRADIDAAVRLRETGSEQSRTPKVPDTRADQAGDIRIPIRGVRRVIAEKMALSRREIPEATTWVDVDATGLIEARDLFKASDASDAIGLLALLARICVAGLKKFPELNARVDVAAAEIVQLGDINLSFAAQSPRGLVVPVVHGAGTMTTNELAAAMRELTELAHDSRLSPAQMTGGTFTLNNFGVFGTDGATPIINYPEAAMLGVGRIIDRPWAHDGQVALRKVGQLGLTFDHRVCDGGTAGGFLRFVADCVEKPTLLLAQL